MLLVSLRVLWEEELGAAIHCGVIATLREISLLSVLQR